MRRLISSAPTKAERIEATFATALSKVTVGVAALFGGPGAAYDGPYTENLIWKAYNAAGVLIGQGTVSGTTNGLAQFTIDIPGGAIKRISLTPGENSAGFNVSGKESDFLLQYIDGGASDSAKEVFTYKLEDANGDQSSANLSITVNDAAPANAPPTSTDDTVTTNEDTTKVLGAGRLRYLRRRRGHGHRGGEDHDAGEQRRRSSTARTARQLGGCNAEPGDQRRRYRRWPPALRPGRPDENGSTYATIGFTVSDGTSFSASAYTLTVDVTPVNDAAAIAGTNAGDVVEDAALTASGQLTVADADTGEDEVQPVPAGTPGTKRLWRLRSAGVGGLDLHARQRARRRAGAGGAGETLTDTIVVTSEDGTDTETITITITGTNDAPVLTGDLSAPTTEGASYQLTSADLGFTDPDDGPADVTFTVSNFVNGEVRVNGVAASTFTGQQLLDGLVTFVHDGSETTAASFDVSVEDGNEDGSAPAVSTFNLTVTPENEAPTAVADTNAGDAVTEAGVNPGNTPFAGDSSATGNVLANDTDPDAGDSKTVQGVQAGSVAGPLAAGVGSSIAGTYGSLSLAADGTWTYSLNNADPDTQALQQGQAASDVFTYTMRDDAGATSTTTLTIAITGTNDAPVAVQDHVVTNEETVLTGDLFVFNQIGPDSDPDGDAFTITAVGGSAANVGNTITLSSGAHVQINSDGSFTFDPRGGFDFVCEGASSADNITYTITDAHGATSTALAVFSVTGVNDAPDRGCRHECGRRGDRSRGQSGRHAVRRRFLRDRQRTHQRHRSGLRSTARPCRASPQAMPPARSRRASARASPAPTAASASPPTARGPTRSTTQTPTPSAGAGPGRRPTCSPTPCGTVRARPRRPRSPSPSPAPTTRRSRCRTSRHGRG